MFNILTIFPYLGIWLVQEVPFFGIPPPSPFPGPYVRNKIEYTCNLTIQQKKLELFGSKTQVIFFINIPKTQINNLCKMIYN